MFNKRIRNLQFHTNDSVLFGGLITMSASVVGSNIQGDCMWASTGESYSHQFSWISVMMLRFVPFLASTQTYALVTKIKIIFQNIESM